MPKGGDSDKVSYRPKDVRNQVEIYGSNAADLIDKITAQRNAGGSVEVLNRQVDSLLVKILEYRSAYRAHTKHNLPDVEVAIHLGYENEEVHPFSKNQITVTLPYPTPNDPNGLYDLHSQLDYLANAQAANTNTYTSSKMFYDNTLKSVDEKLADERPQDSAYRMIGEVKTIDAAIAKTRGQDPTEQAYSRDLHSIKNYVATGLVIVGTGFRSINVQPSEDNPLHINISYGSASTNIWMEHMPLNDRARMRDALEKYGYFRGRR